MKISSRLVGITSLTVALVLLVSGVASAAAPERPQTESASSVTNTAAVLHGVVNPQSTGVTGWYFEYHEGSTCAGGGTTPAEAPREAQAEAVTASISVLRAGTKYTFCLVASNEAEETTLGEAVSLITTAAAPIISGEAVTSVGATVATVSAQIDAGGSPTSYRVEYGSSEAYGESTPELSVGAPEGAVSVRRQLTGLQAGAAYHFRLVAESGFGTSFGGDATFSTGGGAGAAALILPDDRSYELVSNIGSSGAIGNTGEAYVPATAGQPEEDTGTTQPFQASTDGDSLMYMGDPPVAGGTGNTGQGEGNQWHATRGADGWSTSDISPVATGPEAQFAWFSNDLSVGAFVDAPQLTPDASSCDHIYSYTAGDGAFNPLFVTQPSQGCAGYTYTESFAGSSSDGSHLLFESAAALTPEAVQAEEGKQNLYDSIDGRLRLVNVLPSGTSDPDASFGGPRTASKPPSLENAISADGARVFWTDRNTEVSAENPGGWTRLFVLENDGRPQSPLGPKGECTVPADACTVQLDLSKGGSGSGGGRFLAASRDGSKVFFTDCERLTPDATAVSTEGCEHERGFFEGGGTAVTGNDLYEYDLTNGKLTDLTVDRNLGDPLGADVQGLAGISEDGSYAYFVADGGLSSGASKKKCETVGISEEAERIEETEGKLPPARGCNLYVLHEGEGPRLIGTLAPRDDELFGVGSFTGQQYGDWQPDISSRTAEVSPDGHGLVFSSIQPLTGYDNRTLSGDTPLHEIFTYDSIEHRLSCASCDPSGVPPVEEGSGTFLATSQSDVVKPRWISDDAGKVFFDTAQALVPQDSNGIQDVYEWERVGSGASCPTTSPSRSGGCIFLLSSGESSDYSYFVDTSANGSDVFLTTRSQLVAQDQDEKTDMYDARVGGGFPATTLSCAGAGCQGVPPAPPIFATPSSVTFEGVGNFLPSKAAPKPKPRSAKCRRGQVKKHGRCVKRAKRIAKVKHAKAGKRSQRGTK
jgi:hypothetical protein